MTIFRTVTPAYFAAFGIPILRGRGFTEEDRASTEPFVILGETLAHRLFPTEDPVGRRMRAGLSGPWRIVVRVRGLGRGRQFAGIGVLLAAVGQFGVISYLVTQRSAEIAVRMALGTTSRQMVGLVMRNTLLWTLIGAATGMAPAWAAGRYLEAMLFQVKAHDLASFAVVFMLVLAVSLLAAWQPSRRAARVDPAQVLRHH